jgi:hypothetical protein
LKDVSEWDTAGVVGHTVNGLVEIVMIGVGELQNFVEPQGTQGREATESHYVKGQE